MLFIASLEEAKVIFFFYQICLASKIFRLDALEMHAGCVSYWNSN